MKINCVIGLAVVLMACGSIAAPTGDLLLRGGARPSNHAKSATLDRSRSTNAVARAHQRSDQKKLMSTNDVILARLTNPEVSIFEFYDGTRSMGTNELWRLCRELRFKYQQAARLNEAYSVCDEYMMLMLIKLADEQGVDLSKRANDQEVLSIASKKAFDNGYSIGGAFSAITNEVMRLNAVQKKVMMLQNKFQLLTLRRSSVRLQLLEDAQDLMNEAKKNPEKRGELINKAMLLKRKADELPLISPNP